MCIRDSLRTALIGLLTIISSVSFITVGAILLLVRLPRIEAETRSQLQAESDELAGGTEALISALQTQIEMIASTLFVAPTSDCSRSLIVQSAAGARLMPSTRSAPTARCCAQPSAKALVALGAPN